MPSPTGAGRGRGHAGRDGRARRLNARPLPARLDPEVRRGLIVDAAERLLAEGDPLLVSFEEVAGAAGVSRPLVHAYLGDRRGLIDAVQVRLVGRLDTWVSHGFDRGGDPSARLRALTGALFSFVENDHDAWGVLVASGGLDHPALHGVRARWAQGLCSDGTEPGPTDSELVAAQAAVAALLLGVGGWIVRGTDPGVVAAVVQRLLRGP